MNQYPKGVSSNPTRVNIFQSFFNQEARRIFHWEIFDSLEPTDGISSVSKEITVGKLALPSVKTNFAHL